MFYLNYSIIQLSIIPIIKYNNADTQKLDILKDNKGKSGIYCWINSSNGKSYVGSSQNIARRLKQYYSIYHLTKHNGMNINRALLKYGYSSFNLHILEYCDPADLICREQYYMDLLKPEYNILKTAGSSLGFKYSEESRVKMSNAKIGENHPMFGKKYSEEIRANMSGRPRPVGAGKPSQKIEVWDLLENKKTIYDSISATALALGIRQTTVSWVLNKNQKKPYKGRYTFSRVSEA